MPKPVTLGQRSHHLDAARMMLMLIGIPYHAALLFQNEIVWAVSVGHPSIVARNIVAIIHIFRMPAFFLLSGYLAAVVLMKGQHMAWLWGRYVALGVPLLFGVFTLNPLQIFVPAMIEGKALSGSMRGLGLGHLWFLVALMAICSVAVAIKPLIQRTERVSTAVLSAAVFAGASICIAAATAGRDAIAAVEIPGKNAIMAIIWGGGWGLPFFVAGMLMMHRHDVLRRLTLYSPLHYAALLTATVFYVVYMPLEVDSMVSTIAGGLLAIPITTTIILICSRCFHGRSRWMDLMVQSSFTVYLVHHPIVIILGAVTAGALIPWPVHFGLICAVTWGGSLAIWMVARNVPVLNALIGATPLRASQLSWRPRQRGTDPSSPASPISAI